MLDSERFFPGVPGNVIIQSLERSPGNELASGKFWSSQSSAALAANTFGWFIERPEMLPILPIVKLTDWKPERVEIEYCARFPWSGGRHPWLDACVMTPADLIGIESKRFEPFRDKKNVSFSDAYDRPVWGDEMAPFEKARDLLKSGKQRFEFLDAAQLVKHAFGLVTDGERHSRRPHLFYLYSEPTQLGHKLISEECKERHRSEIAEFSSLTAGAAVTFSACSYREWLSSWSYLAGDVVAHGERVIAGFQP
jgi:hypothetical protein